MKKEDLYQAIGQLDEELLAKSEAGWNHSGIWRTILSTAACLILIVGLGSLILLHRGGSSEPAAETEQSSMDSLSSQDHQDCEHWSNSSRLLIGDNFYYSTYGECTKYHEFVDGTVWCYDPETDTTQTLGSIPAVFTHTQTGDYLTDRNTREVYRIEGTTLTKVGALPECDEWSSQFISLIDLVGDMLYYKEEANGGVTFYEKNLADGSVRELYYNEKYFLAEGGYLKDGRLYWHAYINAQLEIYELDVISGELTQKTMFPDGVLANFTLVGYLDDFMLFIGSLDDDEGHLDYNLYKLDYATLEATCLQQSVQMGWNVNQEGDLLYWHEPTLDSETYETVNKIIVYSLSTGEFQKLDAPDTAAYLSAYSGGYYYEDSREDYPGVYYCDYASGTTRRIDPSDAAAEKEAGGIISTDPATPETIPWQTGEQIVWEECQMLLEGDCLYYATWMYAPESGEISDPGIWYYDPKVGYSVPLGDFPAYFVEAQLKNFCVGRDGTVYRLQNGFMERAAALDQGVPDDSRASLIDLVGDTLYYYNTLEQGFGFYAKNINDNSVRELFRETDGSVKLEECRLWNGVIYYETTYQTADPAFYALNVESGESTRLEFDFPYEQYGGLYYTSFCEFYEDFAFVEARFYDEPGVHFYRLDYDTLSATPLASQENAVLDPIHRDGSKIYWESSYFYLKTYGEVEDAYGKVTEYDLETDTITEREEVVYSDQVLANSRGYYYKDTRDAFSGLYYYDYATGTAKQIDNTAVSSEVVPSPSSDKVLHPLEE